MDSKEEQSMEQSILEAAEKLFLEKGFASTSTTQIAREVGCNQALVHYYFRTKENLFNTIFENKFKLLFEYIFKAQVFEEGLTFTEKVKRVVHSHFDMLSQNPKIPTLVVNELARMPENLKYLREKLQVIPSPVFLQFSKELAIEIEAGRARKTDVIDIVITMITLNAGFFMFLPMAKGILQLDDDQLKELIAHRREENAIAVINFIKP
ncbi:MAG: hypothetical protein RIS29_2241 [Bacteroidota bacterium]|jgi:AcrR family transcriptional regulator